MQQCLTEEVRGGYAIVRVKATKTNMKQLILPGLASLSKPGTFFLPWPMVPYSYPFKDQQFLCFINSD